MSWTESASPSFRARHESAHAGEAKRVLRLLESTKEELARWFPATVENIVVVLHRGSLSLSMARPLLPVAWLALTPAARRYLAGWGGGAELHVLTPEALAARASNVPGSREMLALTPAALYAREVIVANNPDLAGRPTPRRIAAELRWAWLLEGAARWFSGQMEHARPAIARRLREREPPSFPPGLRDAVLLGGTVIDLLVRERDPPAAVELACRLHAQGPRASLSRAFGRRRFDDIERSWRGHLERLARTG